MPRPLRLLFPGAVYHVISRGNERKAIFQKAADNDLFLFLLKDCKRPQGGLFLGNEDFVHQFRDRIQKKKDQDFTGKRELLGISSHKLQQHLSGREQAFQIYCLWKFGRLRQKEIGSRFSVTDSAVSHSIRKFEARLTKDRQLDTSISELQNSIFRD